MPTYEYQCRKCRLVFEKKMTIEEKKKTRVNCPHCDSDDVLQQFFGVSFSGKKYPPGNPSGGCCGGGPSCCG